MAGALWRLLKVRLGRRDLGASLSPSVVRVLLHVVLPAKVSLRLVQLVMTGIAAPPRWLTVKETARRLGLHEITVRRKVAAGVIPALQLGGRGCAVRVMEDDHSSWLEPHRTSDSSPAPGNDPAERHAPGFSAVEAQAPGGEAA
jgi:excisionase family DNA binding protein